VEQIQITATFPNIAKENLAEFKRLAGDAMKVTQDDSGALQYDWFFNADETTCVVRETYADSAAILAHLGLVADVLGPLIELGGGIEVEAFGSPSDELLKAAEPFHPTVYSFFQGK
jgi:hypothetical protein